MSEVTKPVEEPVVAPTTTETPAVTEPVPKTKPAETVEPTTETPAVVEPAKEETAAPVKEDVKPVEEGTLGYKGPGLLKSLIFQKKFFWFGTEPVETKSLSSYLRGEKETAAANHTAAWASHTGKGLLFFSKKSTDKATPAGVFNLSEISDISPEGLVAFHFTSGGHKHTFEATTAPERDNWLTVLKTKAEEATVLAGSVKETEEYKKSHSSLTKPAVAAAAVPAAKKEETKAEAKEEKKEEKAEAKEEKKEAKEEKKEEKKEIKEEKKEEKARKSRSASRKRTSIFGGINFGGKKEEKAADPKAEETPVVATLPPVETTPTLDEPIAPLEAPPAPVEPVVATETAATTEPVKTKRNSIFGQLQSRFSTKEKKPEADAPVVPAKDVEPTEPVSETAPIIPQVESSEPLAASVDSPATVPTETTTLPVTNGETKTDTPVIKSDKRKSSLPWLTKKEKPTSDTEEVEKDKPKSPFAKLRATVKGKSSPKAEKVEKTPETDATPAVAPEETPVVSEPVPVQATTPQVTASA